ncbi:flavin monoamine oxidase family protein [Mesorhizobium sp. M00.F.Ca.ET.186.01.1.1]|nr:flavin monoamine oxidase family protein [bacterium M00.F.Ca.ET.205.01.1.1]TGU51886.1 flavin monoamine oxidase family protein [bacterium M00.F.Ca.ET.152.01.1.1]TGV33284.1 flavin monoamine oxidase family protein [Mesorhizobium sp. M00.F.Ca.ET.186.01.1.1]TGZ42425.1 flavin monoamine oxidase family protein [bacterium M00.F.Ca.ET.162.01.1.1]TIW60724.1 MAG: flavin monoamine oxidase family protein [Mesorhizobium sp.]
MSDKSETTEIVIVGAGFTGLSAALELKKAGIGFLLLEARGRVGGRVEALETGPGEPIDSGGQFLCQDMPELMALVRARGKTLVETHVDGAFVAQPAMPGLAAERTYLGSMAIRDRMNGIEPGDPAIAGLTVAAWLERQDDAGEAKAAFRSMIEGLWCLALEKVPLWYLIGNDRRITNEAPELQYFLAETIHSLAEDLAGDLGDPVRLGTPVTRIEHGLGGIRAVTEKGTVEARAVLVAASPVMASRIAFSPPLPDALVAALGAWQGGTVIKIVVRYSRAFWRDKGLSGMVMWRDVPGLFVCDTSKDDKHPALVVFIGGPSAMEWRSYGQEGLRSRLATRLVEALGPEAANWTGFAIRYWFNDTGSVGGYSDLIVDMKATNAERTILVGAPPVYFASSELSPSFPGYIEGAIVAGRIAARKIIADVQSAIATSASGS